MVVPALTKTRDNSGVSPAGYAIGSDDHTDFNALRTWCVAHEAASAPHSGHLTTASPTLTTPKITGAGAGKATLQYANTGTDRTLTLPDALGSSTFAMMGQESAAIDTTVTAGNHSVICTVAGLTITLPTAVIGQDGYVITVKDASGGAGASPITIVGEGAETIDDRAAGVQICEDNGSITFEVSDSKWCITGST